MADARDVVVGEPVLVKDNCAEGAGQKGEEAQEFSKGLGLAVGCVVGVEAVMTIWALLDLVMMYVADFAVNPAVLRLLRLIRVFRLVSLISIPVCLVLLCRGSRAARGCEACGCGCGFGCGCPCMPFSLTVLGVISSILGGLEFMAATYKDPNVEVYLTLRQLISMLLCLLACLWFRALRKQGQPLLCAR
mmetsp:Transcript_61841/g.139349  ORF Transcript_61841/g.139349 Transcript_61841/m.139349 type:complete len:190 (+) Transcript_61841:100-669(+)